MADETVWLARGVEVLQTFAVPLAFWFKPFFVCLALFWLIYRASLVLHKPLDELASLLGFDIPLTPLVDLASIKVNGAIVHWTLPAAQKPKSSLKYEVWLNGTVIDTVSIHETAVILTGLRPACFYVVRVALVNSLEFSSKSAPLRFRTKDVESGDIFVVATSDGHETDPDGAHEPVPPRLRPYRGLKDVAPAAPPTAPMAREGSTGAGPRRTISGRRPSPAALGLDNKHDPQVDDSEPPEGAETIQQLTEKLDAIRRETDEAEKAAKEEEEEELRQKEELAKERDELKAEAMEKEKASRNLKREVNTLERQNTAAQNERTKQERLLQHKRQERQKLKDDSLRWEREAEQMEADVGRIRTEQAAHLEQVAQEKETLRARQAEEATKLRSLDDEIKETTNSIKKLERANKNSSPSNNATESPEPTLVQQYQSDAEEERAWQAHKTVLQQQYSMAFQKVESARRFHAEQIRYLESLRAERRRQEEISVAHAPFSPSSVPSPVDRLPRRGDSQRSRQAPSRHSVSDSPRLSAFPVPSSQSVPFGAGGVSAGGAGYGVGGGAPFLNIHNGMTIAGPSEEALVMTEEEKEKLTGGAPMSPGAGADLLPADLFAGEGDARLGPEPKNVQPLPGLGSLPGLAGLPGPVAAVVSQQQQEHPAPGPASPASGSSHSPSVFASPQTSSNNLHLGSPEGVMDPDRRSIRSTRSNRATSGGGATTASGSRFSGMFGIKQRNKQATSASEDAGLGGPPLGKASSMPRQDQDVPLGLDTATRKRNSSISGAVFGTPEEEAQNPSSTGASRKAFVGLFSRDKVSGGWPTSFTSFGRRPTSPRPGSTHSNELPRPSVDSSRWGVDAWPSTDSRNSPLSFGPGWNTPTAAGQQRLYGSRHPSRRPSVQYGASGPPEDIMEDEDSDALEGPAAPLAPIGTKPAGKPTLAADTIAAAQKLNPNAKDFKSFFSSMKLGGSSKDKGGGSTTPVAATSPLVTPGEEESPPASRKSRDAPSILTTESSLAGASASDLSTRNSADLARTPSYSNSEAPAAPSPQLPGSSKESFMQKISRKSSSGKFSLPNFRSQREKNRLDPSSASLSSSATSAGAGSVAAPPPTSAGFFSTAEEGGGALGEDDALSASVGSLREREGLFSRDKEKEKEKEGRDSKEGSRSSRSWSSVLKLGKGKKGGETPSLSGLSVASGTEDGDEGAGGEEEGSAVGLGL